MLDASPTHGSYHWTFERHAIHPIVIKPGTWSVTDCVDRVISLGLIPLTAAPFIGGSLNPITDAVLCGMLLAHSHIGFQ